VNRITKLPPILKTVAPLLKVVVLSKNEFRTFPPQLRDMPQVHTTLLRAVAVVRVLLTHDLKQLYRLFLNDNRLTEFGYLNAEKLTHFCLSRNKIKHLGNIADVRRLEDLQVHAEVLFCVVCDLLVTRSTAAGPQSHHQATGQASQVEIVEAFGLEQQLDCQLGLGGLQGVYWQGTITESSVRWLIRTTTDREVKARRST